jgi:hypothetical protein
MCAPAREGQNALILACVGARECASISTVRTGHTTTVRRLAAATLSARRDKSLTLLGSGLGAMLFGWSMQNAGSTAVVDGFTRVGAGLVVVVLLGGVRVLVRTAAWRLCLDPEDRLTFGSMFAAYVAGDAIGNVTPFGLLASEPSKIVMVRGRIALPAAVASLALENLFYSATVLVMLVTGDEAGDAIASLPHVSDW